MGANDGHIINRGSQHASGGIDGSPVPPPGEQIGTKSGQGNFAGSQQVPVGSGVIDGQIGCEDVHCVRVGSQHGTEFCVGFALMDSEKDGRGVDAEVMEAEGQINEPVAQFILPLLVSFEVSFAVIVGESVGR